MNYLTKIRRTSKMFNFRRFCALFQRNFMMNRNTFLVISTIHIVGVAMLMVFYSINMPNNITMTDTFSFFYAFFLISCGIGASMLPFRNYDKRYNRSESILLPASIEEKFAVNFIMAFILVPVVTFVTMFLGMELGHLVNWIRFDKYVLLYKETLYKFSHYGNWFSVYLFMSFSFLGAILFKKNKLLKTWAIVFGLGFLSVVGLSIWIYLNYRNVMNGSMQHFLQDSIVETLFEVFLHIVFVACVVGAYLKLRKERS